MCNIPTNPIHYIWGVLSNSKKVKRRGLEGDWNEQKSKLKQRFSELTDSDLLLEEEEKDKLISRLQIKLGKTKDEITTILADL